MGPLQELESALKASPLQRLQGTYHATTVEYDWHGFVNKILLQPDPVSRLHWMAGCSGGVWRDCPCCGMVWILVNTKLIHIDPALLAVL